MKSAVVLSRIVGVEPELISIDVRGGVTARQNLEGLRTPSEDLKVPLVVRGSEVRDPDVQAGKTGLRWHTVCRFHMLPLPLRLAAQPVNPTGALLHRGRVPAQVVVDDMTTIA